jgi:FkbM family methyltransferase
MKKVFGTSIYVPNKDTHFSGMGAGVQVYQHDRVDLALRYLPPKRRRVAVDAGAHVGLLTRKLAQHFERVYAFEPNPEAYACLRVNTEGLKNVTLFPKALGAAPGRAGIRPAPGFNSGDRVLDETAQDVEMTTVDALGLEELDLLKVDVQGYEWYVLQGAARTIRYTRPLMIVEVESKKGESSPFEKTSKQALSLLKGWGAEEIGSISVDRLWTFPAAENIPFTKYQEVGAYHWEKYDNSVATVGMVDQVVAHVQAAGLRSVLDVGCGDGLYTALLTPRPRSSAPSRPSGWAAASTRSCSSTPSSTSTTRRASSTPWRS